MANKILSLILAVLLFSSSLVLPDLIRSYDNVGEKFNYIVPANINMEAVSLETEDLRETYREDILENGLDFQTVSLTERQAERLGLANTVEEDFVVRAETTQTDDVYKAENYTWNIPFVNGTKSDINIKGNKNIKVGILDSGVSLNDEFEDVVRIDLVPNTIYDPIGIYNDVTGHGTSVAGIVAAKENEKGVIGISPEVSVYSIRVLDHNNEAPISRIIAGIEWAIENDIKVLNMSFGTPNYSAQFYNAIRKAYENGIVLVASAGNTGGKTEQVTYPAKFSEVISVGSCNQKGEKSSFSPESIDVDILAPGEYIECIGLMNGYCIENGTSLAAPHVTAAAALIMSVDSAKNPEFVKQLLIATAKVNGEDTRILDIKNALDTLPNFKEVDVIDSAQIPQNTKEIEDFEISEDVVVGSWAKTKHAELIWPLDSYGEIDNDAEATEMGMLCKTSQNNIKLFAMAAYMADFLYGVNCLDSKGKEMGRFAPLHAVGYTKSATSDSRKPDNAKKNNAGMNNNYVADTQYLYRLALHFAKSKSLSEAYKTMNDVPTKNSNYKILRKIVASKTPIYEKMVEYPQEELVEWFDVKGICRTDIVQGVAESSPESAAWKILGLAAHLASDTYAHRVRVPKSSVTSKNGVFYSKTAPSCFHGDNHIMFSGDFIGVRKKDKTKLNRLLKDYYKYYNSYIKNGKLCMCYDCFREAVKAGKVEFRDITERFINKSLPSAKPYIDDNTEFYPKRFEIGATNAVETLITTFNDRKSFSVYTFLPSDKSYKLKLNGLEDYIKEAGLYPKKTKKNQALIDRIELLSTGAIV